MNQIKSIWILTGYKLFAAGGPNALKVEVISRQVKKSKSSFYHLFGDLEMFTGQLLNYHLKRAKIIAEKERQCRNVVPELLHVILEMKEDLLFNRQLRIHRNNEGFKNCFEKASQEVGEAIVGIWADELNLKGNSKLAHMVLNLAIENFYLQITPETLNYEWLVNYVNDLKLMVKEFEHI
ncbi:MAG: TetR/AcrR family transcriptional regulator [Bacteroidota bacterium]